jgi:predicted nucleic acid-binding protein
MSAEFVDTNILVYAHDGGAGAKHDKSVELLAPVAKLRSLTVAVP